MQREDALTVKPGTVCRWQGFWGVMGGWMGSNGRAFDPWHTAPVRLREGDLVEVPKPQKTRPTNVSKFRS